MAGLRCAAARAIASNNAVVDLLRGDGARQRQQQTACDDNSATSCGLILVGATAGFAQ
jgi:hypothetical protein